MADALIPLYSTTLASAVSSVTIAGLPQGYRDLRLIVSGTVSSGTSNTGVQLNGDAGSNYTVVAMEGNGSVASAANGALTFMTASINSPDMTTSLNVVTFDIFDYSQSDKQKTSLARGSNTNQGISAVANRWANTAAVTSIVVKPNSSTFASGTTINLYAIQG
jgi:hypothetical protein